jgi:hypothetical protein
MQAIALPWETWRALIAVLREKPPPSLLEQANVIEAQFEGPGPGEPMVRLSLTDDIFLHSDTGALAAGVPLRH